MKKTEIVKREIEEEVTVETKCDYCLKIIECAEACGYTAYHLSDGYCNSCGSTRYDFCCFECLKYFVNKKLDKQ